MRLILGGGGAGPSAPFLGVLRALFSENRVEFVSSLMDDSAFRVMDCLDGRVLDESTGREGAASLLRRVHENVEVLRFMGTRLQWLPGGLTYDWTAVFRNWGFGPSMNMAGSLHLTFEGEAVRDIELYVDGEAYLDLIHDGRAPRPYDAVPRQQRRIGL